MMALEKQQFDDNQGEQPTDETRITIDMTPALRKRIRAAAYQMGVSVPEYLRRILERAVPEEIEVGEENTDQERPTITNETIERLSHLREQILQERHGKLFEDSAEVVRQMREERSQYLEQLRGQE